MRFAIRNMTVRPKLVMHDIATALLSDHELVLLRLGLEGNISSDLIRFTMLIISYDNNPTNPNSLLGANTRNI